MGSGEAVRCGKAERGVRVEWKRELGSASVREFRKRSMGKEMGCKGARKSCLIIWQFSVGQKVGFYFQVIRKPCRHIAAKFCSLRATEVGTVGDAGRLLFSGKDFWEVFPPD